MTNEEGPAANLRNAVRILRFTTGYTADDAQNLLDAEARIMRALAQIEGRVTWSCGVAR